MPRLRPIPTTFDGDPAASDDGPVECYHALAPYAGYAAVLCAALAVYFGLKLERPWIYAGPLLGGSVLCFAWAAYWWHRPKLRIADEGIVWAPGLLRAPKSMAPEELEEVHRERRYSVPDEIWCLRGMERELEFSTYALEPKDKRYALDRLRQIARRNG